MLIVLLAEQPVSLRREMDPGTVFLLIILPLAIVVAAIGGFVLQGRAAR